MTEIVKTPRLIQQGQAISLARSLTVYHKFSHLSIAKIFEILTDEMLYDIHVQIKEGIAVDKIATSLRSKRSARQAVRSTKPSNALYHKGKGLPRGGKKKSDCPYIDLQKGYKKEASQFIDVKNPDATPKSEIADTSNESASWKVRLMTQKCRSPHFLIRIL